MIEITKDIPQIGTPDELIAAAKVLFSKKPQGFLKMAERNETWSQCRERGAYIREHFERTIIVGIGGSSLGAKALYQNFGRPGKNHGLLFLESPDSIMINRLLPSLDDLRSTHFIFISKSGSTLETTSLLEFLHGYAAAQDLNIGERSTVICGPVSSPLYDWSVRFHVPRLDVPEDVGGRFSVLTPVGLLPAAIMGVEVDELREGARWVMTQPELVAHIAEASLASFSRKEWVTQMWIYSQSCQELGRWWQQLWSESLGKGRTKDGGPAPHASTPMACSGPQDQHSLLQQVQEGQKDKFIILVEDEDNYDSELKISELHLEHLAFSKGICLGDVLNAEMRGFAEALDLSQISHMILKFSSQDVRCWGAFFMLWESVIAVMAERMGIDAFDQPGVELGKRLAKQYLRQ